MRREWQLLFCAGQFMTRLPVPALPQFEADWINRSAKYFPLAGQLVGIISAGVLLLASMMWRGWLPAMLAVTASVLITGALHEDGLADTADGLGGGKNPMQRLAIMKDSRIGSYGVLALGICVAFRVASLAAQTPVHAACSLVAAHGIARAAAVIVMHALPYAGDPASGNVRIDTARPTRREVALALLMASWPLVFLSFRQVFAGILIAGLLTSGLARLAQKLLGGQRGDILGAAEQISEAGFLLGCAIPAATA